MSLITTNFILSPTINTLFNQLNSKSIFGLFQNNIIPTPATTLSQLAPATFAGYASYVTTGKWTAPIKQQDGIYETTCTAGPFYCSAGSQIVYGGYLSDGTNLLYVQLFASPLKVQYQSYFSVPITLQVLSSQL